MKKNEIVEYLGCSTDQVDWSHPRSFLIVGQHYTIEKVKVHSKHTEVKLYNKMGWFNSICFKKVEKKLNTSLNLSFTNWRTMDPSSITLTTPSKSFAYEQQAREIEKCSDLEELRNVCKCYAKLYYKQQETLKTLGLPNELDQ